jgi:hypothetical protein
MWWKTNLRLRRCIGTLLWSATKPTYYIRCCTLRLLFNFRLFCLSSFSSSLTERSSWLAYPSPSLSLPPTKLSSNSPPIFDSSSSPLSPCIIPISQSISSSLSPRGPSHLASRIYWKSPPSLSPIISPNI